MSNTEYCIRYVDTPHVTRSTKTTMAKYLSQEGEAWTDFLTKLRDDEQELMPNHGNVLNAHTITNGLNVLEKLLDNREEFNKRTRHLHSNTLPPPPPSRSYFGALILGLESLGFSEEAKAVFVNFASRQIHVRQNRIGGRGGELITKGDTIIQASRAALALPVSKLAKNQLKAIDDEAEAELASLREAVGTAKAVNEEHSQDLATLRSAIAEKAVKLRKTAIKSERHRTTKYREWRQTVQDEVSATLKDSKDQLKQISGIAKSQFVEREKEFEAIKNLFLAQLRLKAPVKLWEDRAATHKESARSALRLFWLGVGAAIAVGIVVPWLFGSYIAESFSTFSCLPNDPDSCERVLSAKGPLTVAGLLLTTSLLLWAIRMQYKIFLSERHLCLDANERKAFAESYLAMKQDQSVDISNETIVLASLFRPTQDGIIKDEDGGFDISAIAVLAKQLSKS